MVAFDLDPGPSAGLVDCAGVARMARPERRGRVFVDWSQNDRSKSTVCAYSLRVDDPPAGRRRSPGTSSSAPVAAGDEQALRLGPHAVRARLAERGDPFAPVLTLRQALPG